MHGVGPLAHSLVSLLSSLSLQLDPHFSSETSCQICGESFAHSGLLLQHIFAAATSTTGPKGAKAGVVKEMREMHAALFQSFVQELITMPTVGAEETIEYILSLLVPDFDPDEDDEDEEDDLSEDDDDEENDLYEDDEDDGDDPSLSEMEELDEFLSMHGLNLNEASGGGDWREKKAFMKAFMAQMNGMDMDDDEDEDYMPSRGKAKGKSKGGAKPSSSAAAAGQPGDLECESCSEMRSKSMYSAAQLKKKGKRRCKVCIDGAGAAAAASTNMAQSASVAPASLSTFAAAATPAQPAAQPSATNSLHRYHATKHTDASGQEIIEEPEDFEGHEDDEVIELANTDEDEEDEEDEDEDDDDDDDDPFSAIFGGGRCGGSRGRRGAGRSRPASKAAPHLGAMRMDLVVERPGQQLTRDRRLRIRSSDLFPHRSWVPRSGEAVCHACSSGMPSRLVHGWNLACLRCAIRKRWVRNDATPDSDDDDPEEAARAHRAKVVSAPYVSLHASRFPNYRGGLATCARPQCASTKLLVVYDEHDDEWIICAACRACKQKLRRHDKDGMKLVDDMQEPITKE